jgi:hypothetical protein
MIGKKGDLRLMLFLILTLAIAISTIFLFLTNWEKSVIKVYSSDISEEIYYYERETFFYLEQLAYLSLFKTYQELFEEDYYIVKPIYNSDNYVSFGNFNPNLNNIKKRIFKNNFEKNFNEIDFEKEYLNNLKKQINLENYSIYIEEDFFIINFKNITFNQSLDNVDILYNPEINISVNLDELKNFKDIYEFKEKCIDIFNLENRKNCYENNKIILDDFYLNVSSKIDDFDEEYILIELETKNNFLINNKLKKISFSFIPE